MATYSAALASKRVEVVMVTGIRSAGLPRSSITTAFPEHPRVQATVKALAELARTGGASSMMFLPEHGVSAQSWSFPYKTGLAKQMNIANPPRGPIRGTVVVNVSGHTNGSIIDRVCAWVEQTLSARGQKPTEDARAFVALRSACQAATDVLLADRARGLASTSITLPGGQSLALPRAVFDQLLSASTKSTDPAVRTLAAAGDRALRRFYAATNTYDVKLRLPDGRVIEHKDVPRNQPGRIEWASCIPIEIPANVRGEVTLECAPSGSMKAGGYIEQRQYRIHLGDDLFDIDDAELAADAWRADHREIRWDTPHEDADRAEYGVDPAPVPRAEH
jgi:hypothetical protein